MSTDSTEAVLNHHLQAFGEGIDSIMADYTEDSVVIAPEGTYRGLEELRAFFTSLVEGLPEGSWEAFKLCRKEVVGEIAYIHWEALPWILLGTDTFVVRDGKIAVQTYAAQLGSSQ